MNKYHLQSEAFSRAVRTGGAVENPIESAVGNMRVIDALFRSGESGGWEKIQPLATVTGDGPDGYWSGSSPGSTPGLWSCATTRPGHVAEHVVVGARGAAVRVFARTR